MCRLQIYVQKPNGSVDDTPIIVLVSKFPMHMNDKTLGISIFGSPWTVESYYSANYEVLLTFSLFRNYQQQIIV